MTDLDLDLGDDMMDGLDVGGLPTINNNIYGPNFGQYHNLMETQLAQQAQPLHQQQANVPDTTAAGEGTLAGATGAGAGPLPTGFGVQPNANGGSTLTEFTKRRNWSQRVLEELKDFLHILTPDGRILYASPSAEQLTGYKPDELVGKFISQFIHNDDSAIFVREFNESIASGNALRFFYRFRKADQTYTIFESHGHPHLTSDPQSFNSASSTVGYCRGFFMMARPYPTKNASLLDSFLEHKIENERLTRRIAELKREEREEDTAQAQQWRDSGGQPPGAGDPLPTESSSGTHSTTAILSPNNNGNHNDHALMPPPAKPPGLSNTALTQQNLDEANASFKQDSINDKMARYEGATHIETIEMLTGLRYRDGERSQGISTGDASPTLIRGDAGITISVDKDGRNAADKGKKKLKVADEYVCTDCGTLDSPEWRKGPSGPKTLCNACGCELPFSFFLYLLYFVRFSITSLPVRLLLACFFDRGDDWYGLGRTRTSQASYPVLFANASIFT